MLIGATQWFLDVPEGPESLARIKDLGFSSIHINAGIPGETYYIGDKTALQSYQACVDKYAIKIQAISCNFFEQFGFVRDALNNIHPLLKISIKDTLKAAIELKVPAVYFPSFGLSEIKNKQDFDDTSKILRFACQCCDSLGNNRLRIATENSLPAHKLTNLFDKVNHPRLSLLLDTQNPSLWGHSVIDIIKTHFHKLLDQVHVKDGFGSMMGNARLGKGDSRLALSLKCLLNKNYSGSFIIENDYREDATAKAQADLTNLSKMLLSIRPKYEHTH